MGAVVDCCNLEKTGQSLHDWHRRAGSGRSADLVTLLCVDERMAVTIKDIAREAGVSVSTASRVCGNYGYASEAVRERVAQACKRLNYYPNSIAKSMVKKQTNTIGLVVTDVHNEFYIKIIEEVEKNADANGYSIIFANSDESLDKEKKAIRTLLERQVDGILLVPCAEFGRAQVTSKRNRDLSHIRDLIRLEVPVVFVDRYLEGLDVDAVLIENERLAYEYACRLIDMGNTELCLVVPDQNISSILERRKGFMRALEERAVPLRPGRELRCQYTSEAAFDAVQKFLEHDAVNGFFALDYQMTIGVLMALANMPDHFEKEVQVMGFDSLGSYAKLYPGKVVSIVQPVADIGKMALELLIERITARENGSPRKQRRQIRLSF